jgi:hypothetical protein
MDMTELIVQPPIRDLVSGTKMLVGFSYNWVQFITKSCQASMNVVKIGTVTVMLYFRVSKKFCSYLLHFSPASDNNENRRYPQKFTVCL